MTATKYAKGQSLWSKSTGRKSTVDLHTGNRVMMTSQDGDTITWSQRDVDTYFTPAPMDEFQFVAPEDEPCDLD